MCGRAALEVVRSGDRARLATSWVTSAPSGATAQTGVPLVEATIFLVSTANSDGEEQRVEFSLGARCLVEVKWDQPPAKRVKGGARERVVKRTEQYRGQICDFDKGTGTFGVVCGGTTDEGEDYVECFRTFLPSDSVSLCDEDSRLCPGGEPPARCCVDLDLAREERHNAKWKSGSESDAWREALAVSEELGDGERCPRRPVPEAPE